MWGGDALNFLSISALKLCFGCDEGHAGGSGWLPPLTGASAVLTLGRSNREDSRIIHERTTKLAWHDDPVGAQGQ